MPRSTGLLHKKLIPVGDGGNRRQEAQERLFPTSQAGRMAYPTMYLLSSVFTQHVGCSLVIIQLHSIMRLHRWTAFSSELQIRDSPSLATKRYRQQFREKRKGTFLYCKLTKSVPLRLYIHHLQILTPAWVEASKANLISHQIKNSCHKAPKIAFT